MSDLFGNYIVGFPTRWLKCHKTTWSNLRLPERPGLVPQSRNQTEFMTYELIIRNGTEDATVALQLSRFIG